MSELEFPFYGYTSGRFTERVCIVRETPTQLVDEDDGRWRKKDRRRLGDADRFFALYLILPGDDDYLKAKSDFTRRVIASRVSGYLGDADRSRATPGERIASLKKAIVELERLQSLEQRGDQ